MDEEKVRFATGSTRSKRVSGQLDDTPLRYDLIPHVGLRRLARRYGLGAERHGDRNWEKGQPADAVINHMLGHLFAYIDGDRSDDHVAAFAWGAFALMFFEERLPEMLATLPPPRTGEEADHG